MQVSVEVTGALERRMTVHVPQEEIDDKIEERLATLAKQVRLDGFRPGKVPMRVVRQRFGNRVRQEVLGEVVQSSFQEAVTQEQLHLAGGPTIEPVSEEAAGEDFGYTATFEVYPDVELTSVRGVSIHKPVCEVTEDDVDRMIENLRQQRMFWQIVDREARLGDRVHVDYTGRVDGKTFEGGEGRNVAVVLGAKKLFPGFEDQLEGIRPDEIRQLQVEFPENYQVADLAGKTVEFEVKGLRVEESKLPELNADFVHSFGVDSGSLEELRQEVRTNMEREVQQIVRSRVKEQVMDWLLEKHHIEIPKSLVQEEIGRLREQTTHHATGKLREHNLHLPDSIFEDQASRRVALGLLLAELVKVNNIQLDKERVRKTIETVAQSYDHPSMVIDWYYKQPEQLASVESMVLEDQVVDWVLNQAEVQEKLTTFDALVNERRPAEA